MTEIRGRILSILRDGDLLAKFACLILAVILWLFIADLKVEKQRYRILIQVKNLPANLAVAQMSPRYASVEVEGKREVIGTLDIKGLKAVVNLEKAVEGEHRAYDIELERQQVPDDITATLLDRSVTLTVERKESRWVRVVPVVATTLPAGKIVIDRTVVPERVKITGPRSVINSIDSLETDELSVFNETGEVQRIVGLKKGLPREVSVNEKIFMVRLLIVDRKNLVSITAPLELRNVPNEYEVESNDREVEVYIRTAIKRVVTQDDVDTFVDLSRLNFAKLFEAGDIDVVQRELPIIVVGKRVATADVVSFLPKKTLVRIRRK